MSRAPMHPARPTVRHAGLIAAMALVMLTMALTLVIGIAHGVEIAELLFSLGGTSAFTAVGVVILWQRPGHGIGRLTLAMGILFAAITTIAIAITRYHLYAIDRTISRTITYGLVTAVLFGVFSGMNLDRRFHRARYDAEQTVAGLAGRLRDEVDIVRLRQEILDVVDRSVEPTDVHLWLRHGSAR